jgi:hypothetical protein
MKVKKWYVLIMMPLMLCSAVRGSLVGIDFGGNYSSANINSAKTETYSSGDFDFDGSADDRVSKVAFGSVFTPPNSANWTNIAGKSNGTIYHGISLAILNKTNNPAIGFDRLAGTVVNDRIQIGGGTTGETNSLAVALYWNSTNFLNGGSAALADETNSLSVTLNGTGVAPSVRFLVQAGGQWYVSATSNTASFSINGATASWYAFDPAANAMFLDTANLGTAVSGTSLGAITAAGVYAQTMKYTGGSSLFGMDAFKLTVVPEPATIGMLGLGAISILICRRFRS